MSEHRAWIVTDGSLWAKLTEIRRREIKTWLLMNGVDPGSVPVDCTVMVAESDSGEWEIHYEEYRRNGGYVVIDPSDPDSAYVDQRTVPMAIDPPQYWLIPAMPDAA